MPTMRTRSQKVAKCIDSIRKGLVAAFNAGIGSRPDQISFVNWLGDDYAVCLQSLSKLQALLPDRREVVLNYGHRHYINTTGKTLFIIRASPVCR